MKKMTVVQLLKFPAIHNTTTHYYDSLQTTTIFIGENKKNIAQ